MRSYKEGSDWNQRERFLLSKAIFSPIVLEQGSGSTTSVRHLREPECQRREEGMLNGAEDFRLSVVVPIKLTKPSDVVLRIIEHYECIAKECIFPLEVIIADGSSNEIAGANLATIDTLSMHAVHVISLPERRKQKGCNDKINGIIFGMKAARFDRTIILDDHYRPSAQTLLNLILSFEVSPSFCCLCSLQAESWRDKFDLVGGYALAIMSSKPQFYGNFAVRRSLFFALPPMPINGLFDEYTMYRHVRQSDIPVAFLRSVAIECIGGITVRRFIDQRIRYAYENFAFPLRTLIHLSILPTGVAIGFYSEWLLIAVLLAASFMSMLFALLGILNFGAWERERYYAVLAPAWFFLYGITSWLALFMLFCGGVRFGGNQIVRPA